MTRRALALAAVAVSLAVTHDTLATFVPPAPLGHSAAAAAGWRSGAAAGGRGAGPPATKAASPTGEPQAGAAAGGEPEYQPYDWQRVAEAKTPVGGGVPPVATEGTTTAELDIDSLPDLPDLSGEAEDEVSPLGAKVRVREVQLPELPGDPDLLPPEPNPIVDGGLGLLEWTGIWIGGLLVIAALGGAASYALARAKMDAAFADTALSTCKVLFGAFEVLFLARVLLTQFPKVKTTEMPWALAHYPTEWALAPTRAIFKPEAGVDVAPILWLLLTLLAAELLTGPAGVLQLAREGPKLTLPPGMLTR